MSTGLLITCAESPRAPV